MKIKITKASKYLAQGQVVECPKSIGLRFIALGKAVEYKDNYSDNGNYNQQQDELDRSTQSLVQTADVSQTEVVNLDPPPTPRRKRKPRKPRSN